MPAHASWYPGRLGPSEPSGFELSLLAPQAGPLASALLARCRPFRWKQRRKSTDAGPVELRQFLTLVLCQRADVQRTANPSGSMPEITGISVSYGAAGAAAPSRSDIRLLRQDQSVIDLDSEVADCALQLGVAEQKLAGPQISGALVDQCDFGAPQTVRAV